MNKKVEELIVRQIEREAYSSNLYLAMASWAERSGLAGTAQWLYVQADEERLHLLKFIAYINERGGKAIIPALEQPPVDYASIKQAFEQVLEHEEFITNSIHEIVAVCTSEKDFTTLNWIQWFVNEQIEEEKNVRTILDKIKLAGDTNLYFFDKDIMALRAAAAQAEATA